MAAATGTFSRALTASKGWIASIGEAGLMLARVAGKIAQGRIDWEQVLIHLDRSGIGSLPIVAVSATFIGMAISVQFAREIVTRYGADNLVGSFVAVSMFRELAPVFVAVVLAGNIGAAMTAEIGAMKVTDQVDALEVFHIPPLEYLVVPRLLATMLVGPLLTAFGAFMALLSGQLFTEFMVNIPGDIYWESVQFGTRMIDVVNMLVKALVFSVAIAVIAASNGLTTTGSSEAVGRNTTGTVVWCLLAIFMLNYLLTSLFFQF